MNTSTTKRIPVAVFDYDGTCISSQSGRLFTLYLLRAGILSPLKALPLIWWGLRYKLHLPHNQGEVRSLLFEAMKGFSAFTIDTIMRNFHADVLVPIYRKAAKQEIAQLKAEGYTVLLVSATFEPIAEQAAKLLGITDYCATRMQKDAEGAYTGRVDGDVVEGRAKLAAVNTWCNQHLGEDTWELERVYGDHHSDKYVMEQAKQAFAVNPGQTLEHIAKRRDWTILDWDSPKTKDSAVCGEEHAMLKTRHKV